MATGPEHYREAEKWFTYAGQVNNEIPREAFFLAAAQVHATLALAAATALASTGVGEADLGEWTALICEPDDPYEGMTNADVLSADELYEDDRAAEFALDAADDARNAERDANPAFDALDYTAGYEHEDGDEF